MQGESGLGTNLEWIDKIYSIQFNGGIRPLSIMHLLSRSNLALVRNAKSLWTAINTINQAKENFYGGEIWYKKPYSEFYNAPKLKGKLYCTRRRLTEIHAKNKLHSPSPTFNCVGPGSVGTGSLAGMRVLNLYKSKVNIWPFDNYKIPNKKLHISIYK